MQKTKKFFLLSLPFWFFLQSPIYGKKPLPTLENIGHIPVQWVGLDDEELLLFSSFKEHVDAASSIVLIESNRFHSINEELINNLWSTLAGRQELKQDFELDCFFNLYVTKKSDHFLFEARLLSADLEFYLVEQDFVSLEDSQTSDFTQIKQKISDLTYRLLNRLPIDIFVTSTQGRYITLNGGLNQGLHFGDQLDIHRAFVVGTHPAHGGFKDFETQLVGKVKLIDSQSSSAVAIIESQPYEGAIQIGDGSKIARIVPRSYYALADKGEKENTFDRILIPPSGKKSKANPVQSTQNPRRNVAQAAKMDPTIQAATATEQSNVPPPPPSQSGVEPKIEPTPQETSESGEELLDTEPIESDSGLSVQPFQDYLSQVADDLTVAFGQGTWNYTGPGNTGSKFVFYYPVNFLNARLTRQFAHNLKYGIGGGLSFGKTKNNGAYFGYDGHVRAFWEDKLQIPDFGLEKYQAGANGRFTGLGVSLEGYGGGDVVMGGIFGALHGKAPISGEKFDWLAEYSITPLTIGRIGYDGSRKVIRSSLGWEFIGQLVQSKKGAMDKNLRWGGSLAVGNHTILDNAGNETSKSHFNLAAVMQIQI